MSSVTSVPPDVPNLACRAWRLSYGAPEAPSRQAAAGASWPAPPQVSELPFSSLLDQSPTHAGAAFEVIWAGPGAGELGIDEPRLEAWLIAPGGVPSAIQRASVRTVRVSWLDRRCLFLGPADCIDDTLDALCRFLPLAHKTTEVERELKAVWPQVEAQGKFLLAGARLSRQQVTEIESVTERLRPMNSTMLMVDAVIDQLSPDIPPLSKRLFSELTAQGALESRLELLDAPIEFAWEQCALLNQRAIDGRQAAASHRLEKLIAMFLLVEVALSVALILLTVTWPPQLAELTASIGAFFGMPST